VKAKTMEQVVEEAMQHVTREKYNGGECWLYPVFNKAGYAICFVGRVRRSLSRVVLCVHSGKPINYKVNGVRMEAGHLSRYVCIGGNCINPEHLVWQTPEQNAQQREAEELLATVDNELGKHDSFLAKLIAYNKSQKDRKRRSK